jgi:hypothetical protein
MLKDLLKNWLFKADIQAHEDALKLVSDRFQKQFADYAASEKVAKDKFLASFDVGDYVLAQLKGFSPKLLEKRNVYIDQKTGIPVFDDDIVDAAKKAGISEDLLYTQAAGIANNEVFQFVIDFLISRQIMLTHLLATSDKESQFGRAQSGAYALARGEFERLQSIYKERNAPKAAFDDTAALTPTE